MFIVFAEPLPKAHTECEASSTLSCILSHHCMLKPIITSTVCGPYLLQNQNCFQFANSCYDQVNDLKSYFLLHSLEISFITYCTLTILSPYQIQAIFHTHPTLFCFVCCLVFCLFAFLYHNDFKSQRQWLATKNFFPGTIAKLSIWTTIACNSIHKT